MNTILNLYKVWFEVGCPAGVFDSSDDDDDEYDGHDDYDGYDDDATASPKEKRKRKRRVWESVNDSSLAKELDHPHVADEATLEGKAFVTRTRVPYAAFLELVQLFRHHQWYDEERRDALGRRCHRLDLLICASLRYLAYNTSFDLSAHMAGMGRATFASFFNDIFVPSIAGHNRYFIRMPETKAELDVVHLPYAAEGFPGCLGSIDAVHVDWICCPAVERTNHTGKEKRPTRVYQCVASHSKKFLSVSRGFPGSQNDLFTSRRDKGIAAVNILPYIEGTPHSDYLHSFTYTLHTEEGKETRKGGYLLCDGGYHPWPCLVTAYKVPVTDDEQLWSRRQEGMRKDVECMFGILKKKFRILQAGVRNQTERNIDDIFLTCCCLYNLAHKHKGWDEEINLEGSPEDVPGGGDDLVGPVANAGVGEGGGVDEEAHVYSTTCEHHTTGECLGSSVGLVDSVINLSCCCSCGVFYHLHCAVRKGAHSQSGYCSAACEARESYDHEQYTNIAARVGDVLLDEEGATAYEPQSRLLGEREQQRGSDEHIALRRALVEHYAIWRHERRSNDIAGNVEQWHN